MNKVILIGRLTKEPELKFIPNSGNAVASFSIAVDRNRKNANGEKEADFINIVVYGKMAESTANYSGKGKLIGISGRLQIRNYTGNDGIKRYVTEVIADEVQFIEFKGKQTQGINSPYDDEMTFVEDEEIPF